MQLDDAGAARRLGAGGEAVRAASGDALMQQAAVFVGDGEPPLSRGLVAEQACVPVAEDGSFDREGPSLIGGYEILLWQVALPQNSWEVMRLTTLPLTVIEQVTGSAVPENVRIVTLPPAFTRTFLMNGTFRGLTVALPVGVS